MPIEIRELFGRLVLLDTVKDLCLKEVMDQAQAPSCDLGLKARW